VESKADFYVGTGTEAEWLGSLLCNGSIWYIPLEILIQINKTMFEELTLEFLRNRGGIVPDEGGYWPHMWEDSLMTDYAFIFDLETQKVCMHQRGVDFLADPIMILQGHCSEDCCTLQIVPEFPRMDPMISERKRRYTYGPTYTQII